MLIEKLKYYGVIETDVDRIKSCLHNRRQSVDMNVNNFLNYSCTWEIVKRGVPQELVLGHLLFATYIKYLPRHINLFTNVLLFADDTSILSTEKKILNVSTKRLGLL